MSERSYVPLSAADLLRLGVIAREDRESLFLRKPELGHIYANRVFAVALCQGAALHYLDRKHGIKDLDVWTFFRTDGKRPFPYRRRGVADFGDPKFGKTDGSPDFVGRRVDLLGRSIPCVDYSDPVAVLRDYLARGETESARLLSQKAAIMIEPAPLLGRVVWPRDRPRRADCEMPPGHD